MVDTQKLTRIVLKILVSAALNREPKFNFWSLLLIRNRNLPAINDRTNWICWFDFR